MVNEALVPITATEIKGKFFQTAKSNISAVTLTQGATTLVLGTDYQIYDATIGLIRLLSTSPTIVDGTIIEIDYTPQAITGTAVEQVYAVVNSSIQGTLLFRPNNSDGPKRQLKAWKVTLQPGNELALISDEFFKFSLSGKVLSDTAGAYGGSLTSPYFTMQDVIANA